MTSFSANLLPRVEKAGGGYYPSLATGRPVVIHSDQSARRPGDGWTRKPVRLPAERLRQAHSDFQSTGRRLARRDLVAVAFSRARDRLGVGSAGWNSVSDHGQPVPLKFVPAFKASGSLLLGNALIDLRQKSASRRADRFHVNRSFRDAPAFHEQITTERIPHDAKSGARPGNLAARKGNAY